MGGTMKKKRDKLDIWIERQTAKVVKRLVRDISRKLWAEIMAGRKCAS